MYFVGLSNLSLIYTHGEVLAIVSLISKKFNFFSNVLKPPQKIALHNSWQNSIIRERKSDPVFYIPKK